MPRKKTDTPAVTRARAPKAATRDSRKKSPASDGDPSDETVDSTRGEEGTERESEHEGDEDRDSDAPPAGEVVEAEIATDADSDDDGEDKFAETDPDLRDDAPISVAPTSLARLDPMAAYLREVQRHPLLVPEKTQELAVAFLKTQDPAIAAQLVTANLRLVVKIAYEYRRAYKNIMDLVQEGNIGLMQAVKRYDPYRGVKLSSYAAWWIRAYILRFILNNWRLVKLGTTQAQRKLFFNLRKKRAELEALGIEPSHAEIAKSLNVPESDVAEMDVRLGSNEKSLDAPVGDADGRSISKIDMMPSSSIGPEAMMADGELQSMLKEKLADFRRTLDGKEKDLAIFDKRLIAEEPLTLQELGDRFGISRERVRQLEQRLLQRLRDFLRAEMGDATLVD